MKRYLAYIPFLLIPLIDQYAKSHSHFILNQHYMMGLFSHIPLLYKSVLTISLFLIIFTIYIFFLVLLIPEVLIFRLSASTYMAGILSNCIDKMLYLGVRDHLTIYKDVFFNLADAAQLVSLPVLIFSLLYYSEELWGENSLRKSFFIGVKSQLKISFYFGSIVATNLVFVGMFFLSYMRFMRVSQTSYDDFYTTYGIFSISIISSSFVFILIYSQRIVGPFISFKEYLKNKKYKNQSFKIRKGDPLIELEEIAELIRKEIV